MRVCARAYHAIARLDVCYERAVVLFEQAKLLVGQDSGSDSRSLAAQHGLVEAVLLEEDVESASRPLGGADHSAQGQPEAPQQGGGGGRTDPGPNRIRSIAVVNTHSFARGLDDRRSTSVITGQCTAAPRTSTCILRMSIAPAKRVHAAGRPTEQDARAGRVEPAHKRSAGSVRARSRIT
jgi:hypothetical protein